MAYNKNRIPMQDAVFIGVLREFKPDCMRRL